MIERIIVPLDGSPLSERVLPRALAFFHSPGVELNLLVVVDTTAGFSGTVVPVTCSGHKAKDYLADLAARYAEEGVKVTTDVRFGHAAGKILAHAEESRASLIAMATHGRTGLERLVRGSVAEEVLRLATVPVFLHRAGGTRVTPPETGLRILVPLDGSAGSESILPCVRWIATRGRGMVELLRVAEWGPSAALAPHAHVEAEAWTLRAENYVKRMAEQLRAEGIDVQPVVEHGGAAVKILERAASGDIHLVAMSTHGYSGVPRWVFGSVAEEVLRGIRVPLLAIREHRSVEARVAEGSNAGRAE